jgi:hypothetical protein
MGKYLNFRVKRERGTKRGLVQYQNAQKGFRNSGESDYVLDCPRPAFIVKDGHGS